jgi:hypothetical protein
MLTVATLAELRKREADWLAADDSNLGLRRLAFQVTLLAHAPALLAAAEALAKILAMDDPHEDLREFGLAVCQVLDELDARQAHATGGER